MTRRAKKKVEPTEAQLAERQEILNRISPNGTLSLTNLADLLLEMQSHNHSQPTENG